MITQVVDDSKLVTLPGNTSPKAKTGTDEGPLAADTPLKHLWLQLKRSPERQEALDRLASQVSDPLSPAYHNFLTAAEFSQQFGVSQADIQTVSDWLVSQGLQVEGVAPNRTLIAFSGTAGQIGRAFHAGIHQVTLDGKTRFSNVSDPQIPEALTPAVAGVVKLNNFMPHPMHTAIAAKPTFTDGTGYYSVTPQDLATIYNFDPLFKAGYTGRGQTIVVIENSNVYSIGDWTQFRKTFGLTRPYGLGSFAQIHPSNTSIGCDDPGANGDDGEAIIDAQWASAAAPNAQVVLASCADTEQFGGFIAMQNLLDSTQPPSIISISYGAAERQTGRAENAFINNLYEQAAVEGVSVFAAAGDSGADANISDRIADVATHGINASSFASTIYNVAVGGTDFADSFLGNNDQYWNATNTPFLGSAKSYIPEIPWNSSCASSLLVEYLGYPAAYGPDGLCNSALAAQDRWVNVTAGSGAPSILYAKPGWQKVFGNPADQVRDLPDVSLFAANGLWGHYYAFCTSEQGHSCVAGSFYGVGGTSLSSPIMAGMQALVNQRTGSRSGNPNPVLYRLGRSEYGSAGSNGCNSSLGTDSDSGCVFHDVTLGDNDVVCSGTVNCFTGGAQYGALSKSSSEFKPAYRAHPGWDFATGLGSVNAYRLVMAWPASPTAQTSTPEP